MKYGNERFANSEVKTMKKKKNSRDKEREKEKIDIKCVSNTKYHGSNTNIPIGIFKAKKASKKEIAA